MQTVTPKIVITDLDGTLRSIENGFTKDDLEILDELKNKNIIRVIATGRSLFSLRKVIEPDFPIDYIIFSSGAGIMNWNTKEIILEHHLNGQEVKDISNILLDNKQDFMIHRPIPENHKFVYFSATGNKNPDFLSRCDLYKDYIMPLEDEHNDFGKSCQILVVIPNNLNSYNRILRILNPLKNTIKIIRTTSPLDGDSIWLEIFPKVVSKGKASDWLCDKLKIDKSKTLAFGNDYNDIDLLNWAKYSYVVADAPNELKNKFLITKRQIDSGFSEIVKKLI